MNALRFEHDIDENLYSFLNGVDGCDANVYVVNMYDYHGDTQWAIDWENLHWLVERVFIRCLIRPSSFPWDPGGINLRLI